MDTAQWPQEIVVKPIEEIVTNTCPKPASSTSSSSSALERKARPQKEQPLNCPRCNSTNTKFCYYNNYSLTQPRYFCKTCRRYWTEGGSLRNIPVGGGSRKNKRSSSSSSSTSPSSSLSSSSKNKLPDLVTPQTAKVQQQGGHDLNLAFPTAQGIRSFSELIQMPSLNETNNDRSNQISSPASSSALELLTGISSRGLSSFMPMTAVQDPNSIVYTTTGGFPLQDFKPSLNFSLDGLESGYGSSLHHHHHHHQESSGRLLFPFEDLKHHQVATTATTSDVEQNNREHGDSTGYWSGMLGGGSW